MSDSALRTACPNPACGKRLRVPEALAGRDLKCPKCGTVVPAAAADPADPPAWDATDLLLRNPSPTPAADADLDPPDPKSKVDRVLAGAAAVVLHAVFLILLALLGSSGRGEAGPAGESVGFAQLDAEQLTNTDDGQLDDSAASSGGNASDTLTTTVELAVAQPGADAADGLDLSLAAGGGGGGGGGGGDGFGFGSKGGAGGEASFLGTTARGNRFCIIADNSGSMSGPPLEYVKQEVLKTLTEARGGAKFYVVFFNSVAEPQPLPRWTNGKADANAIATWVRGIQARGGTTPIRGFEVALQLSPPPDVVYFMTDGGFSPAEVGQIDALNKRLKKPAVVHSICFLNNIGEPLLRQIAADAKGTYRYVPGFRRP